MANDSLGFGSQGPDIKRLLLAVLLMTGVLMVYNAFFAPKEQPSQEVSERTEKKPEIKEQTQEGLAIAAQPVPNIALAPSNLPLVTKEFAVNMKSSANSDSPSSRGYKATVTSEGGQISEFQLTGYQPPIDLGVKLSALASRDANITLLGNERYELISSDQDSVVFQHMTPEGVKILRRYHFLLDQFVVEQDIELHNQSAASRKIALNILIDSEHHGEKESSGGFFSPGGDQTGIVWRNLEKRERVAIDDLKPNQQFDGSAVYAGFDKRYFLAAMMPKEPSAIESVGVGKQEESSILLSLHAKPIELAPGMMSKLSFSSYLGPKQLVLLQQAGYQLEENIDFGWFGILSRPLLWLLGQIFAFVGNFGIAIILLTLLIKLLTFPLTQKSFVSMQQMKKIAPEIKELQKKYSHDRATLGQKQMELYREKGINPMAGCLPMLIQMPIWFALYQMLWNSVELYQQPFALWITDLTQPDPYFALPILMGVSMLIQQAFQPTMEDQPQMKYVMWAMPIFLTFIMLKLPAGLSLYIFTNNILTIFQQIYIKRRYGT